MNVVKIPATKNIATFMPIDTPTKRRVAGYARVSTDSEEQQTSYAAQVSYYTNYIKSRDDWEFVDVYTDEGIFGFEHEAPRRIQPHDCRRFGGQD